MKQRDRRCTEHKVPLQLILVPLQHLVRIVLHVFALGYLPHVASAGEVGVCERLEVVRQLLLDT